MNIVKEGPLHGYGLTQMIEEKFGWKPSQTAVYNSLKNLENDQLVTSTERIESGRAQKVYSITEKGHHFIADTKQKIRKQMMKNFNQLFSIGQMFYEIENKEESEALHKSLDIATMNFMRITQLMSKLAGKAPYEVQEFIEETLSSLKDLAKKYDVTLSEKEEE